MGGHLRKLCIHHLMSKLTNSHPGCQSTFCCVCDQWFVADCIPPPPGFAVIGNNDTYPRAETHLLLLSNWQFGIIGNLRSWCKLHVLNISSSHMKSQSPARLSSVTALISQLSRLQDKLGHLSFLRSFWSKPPIRKGTTISNTHNNVLTDSWLHKPTKL